MKQYQKIQTVYKRNPNDKLKTLLEGEFSIPEFELLQNIIWQWTEKIDGTNIKVMPEPNIVRFGGKTDDSQISTHLIAKMQDMFDAEELQDVFENTPDVCLYGEGYGVKIQKGENYINNDVGFILFDVRIGNWWLSRELIEEIAQKLRLPVVPLIGEGTLLEAVEYVRKGFKSTIADNKNYDAEGLVMKPKIDLFTRQGLRIISKIKHKDF